MNMRRNFEALDGAVYSAAMARPGFSIPWARTFWRGDLAPFYAQMSLVTDVSEGATVVDCPCGAGVSLAAIARRDDVRYLAVDLSSAMLRRAERVASKLGVSHVEFLREDAAALPLMEGQAELYLSNWGLHCFERPLASLIEAFRVLKPGGRLRGCCFVAGEQHFMQRRMVRPGVSVFRNVGSRSEIEQWIVEAGFASLTCDQYGPMLYFDAEKPRNLT